MKPLKKLNTGFNSSEKREEILNADFNSREKNEEISNSNSTDTASISTDTSITTSSEREARTIQNFRLVWLDSNIDEVSNHDCMNTIGKLRQVVNAVKKFTDVDKCIEFMTDIEHETLFMIVSGELGQTIVPSIHGMTQLNCIYIFCRDKARHEQWSKEWPKVKGVYTDIKAICQALKRAAQDCDQNSISISFVKSNDGASNQTLDTLDKSFMYTQLLKEILLTIDFDKEHIIEFLAYCREQLIGNTTELENVDKIAREYRRHKPIWWYTYQSFLYSMLNRALRMMEVDLIIKMGFFVRDLHNHIATLYSEQYGGKNHSDSFTVYRGQGLSQKDFDQLMKTKGGLLSFNNFLSTSKNGDVSLGFAREAVATYNLVGVLFIMKIDPSISATPFANVMKVSYYENEEEILFSMHSVFRIGQMKQIDKNDRLWQVDLTLTSDDDPQLHALTESMRQETFSGYTGWLRLGEVLIKLCHYDKAQQVYEVLLSQASDDAPKAFFSHQLGSVTYNKGEYEKAITFYSKAIEIYETRYSNDIALAVSYNDIGLVYEKMGELSKALLFHEKTLKIHQKTLPPNHPRLVSSYNNIGSVYWKIDENSKALSYYEKALEICQATLPANHPNLVICYNNIGNVYNNMGEYSRALSYYEKTLEIFEKILPSNHPNLATAYNNIGWVYEGLGNYPEALKYCERALDIYQQSLSPDHTLIKNVKVKIELIKNKL
jgi:tetratricopeptide (TPR) repeat protein